MRPAARPSPRTRQRLTSLTARISQAAATTTMSTSIKATGTAFDARVIQDCQTG
jgi:hypothetical protein